MSDVTQLLRALQRGQTQAADELLPLVYGELRRLARSKLLHEQPGQTLQPTALVHEAFVRLVEADDRQRWDSRGHFFAAAAEAMRRILVENARRKSRVKHGGDHQRVEMREVAMVGEPDGELLLALDEALDRFAAEEPEKAQLVNLRYFAGMSLNEAADAMNISRATASRYWTYAKAWLYNAIAND